MLARLRSARLAKVSYHLQAATDNSRVYQAKVSTPNLDHDLERAVMRMVYLLLDHYG